jgi:hypothetical protein
MIKTKTIPPTRRRRSSPIPDCGSVPPAPGVPVIVAVAVMVPVLVAAGEPTTKTGVLMTAVDEGIGVSVGAVVTAATTTPRVGVVTATRRVGGADVPRNLGIRKTPPTAINPSRSKPTKPSAITTNNRLGPPPAGAISAMF